MGKINYLLILIIAGVLSLGGCSDVAVPPAETREQHDDAIGKLIMHEMGIDEESVNHVFSLPKATSTFNILFDQGPSTGAIVGCWASWSNTWNVADQFWFNTETTIQAIRIFTCQPPIPERDVYVKILSDVEDLPEEFLYEEFREPMSWVSNPDDIGYVVTVVLTTPFRAEANTKYWASVSGDFFGLGQYSVVAPTDGILAGFRGQTFLGKTSAVGDMCFQLLGEDAPPEIFMSMDRDILWPANHKMVRVAQGVYATDDNDDPTLTFSVASNEALNAHGDGNTESDWQVVENDDGSFDVYLRAERAGKGDGRVYTITADAVDGAGNESQVFATVSVPKSQKKK